MVDGMNGSGGNGTGEDRRAVTGMTWEEPTCLDDKQTGRGG